LRPRRPQHARIGVFDADERALGDVVLTAAQKKYQYSEPIPPV
jgi:hypothetical protein